MSRVDNIPISFLPHYNTLTQAGESQFERPVDAIAEFVDNSIQACNGNDQRKIQISFFLNNQPGKETGFVTILDNGVGMDINTIKEFATYGLDRRTRGIFETHSAALGKFGVGAKQAGFYLGDRIRLLTKCKGDDQVKEFLLDSKTMKEKFEGNEAIYEGHVKCREKGDNPFLPEDESCVNALQIAVKGHVERYDSFTIFIIRMHAEKVRQLLGDDKYRDVPNQLAQIYHFHLFPEDLPANITRSDTIKNADGSER